MGPPERGAETCDAFRIFHPVWGIFPRLENPVFSGFPTCLRASAELGMAVVAGRGRAHAGHARSGSGLGSKGAAGRQCLPAIARREQPPARARTFCSGPSPPRSGGGASVSPADRRAQLGAAARGGCSGQGGLSGGAKWACPIPFPAQRARPSLASRCGCAPTHPTFARPSRRLPSLRPATYQRSPHTLPVPPHPSPACRNNRVHPESKAAIRAKLPRVGMLFL